MSTKYDFFPEMREFFSIDDLEALSFKRQIEGYDKFSGSVAFFVKVICIIKQFTMSLVDISTHI